MADNNPFEDKKVTLDKSELDLDRAKDKVELDLDDAPFLEEEEEDTFDEESSYEDEKDSEVPAQPVDRQDPKQDSRKKTTLIAAIAAVVVLIILAVVFFMPDRKSDPGEQRPAERPSVLYPEPETVFEEIIKLKPFMVELREGINIRFLHTSFSLPARNERLAREVKDKNIILRDAIYYYLRNQDVRFLEDWDNTDRIKNDLLAVVNQYLSSGNIENILIEEYLVR